MPLKLSVAIPTYNGAATIREALDSIVHQLEEGVEIVVSDNASTDATCEIVHEYQSQSPAIRYFRNDENLGVDRNFDLAVERASGIHLWFFGDDDKMAHGAIRKVLQVLEDNPDVALVFMNCRILDRRLDKCLKERVIDIDRDTLFEKADDFFQRIGATAALVPSSVVRRDLWLSTDRHRHAGTGWLHLATLFSLLPGQSSYCISEPYVLYRDGSSRWHENGRFLRMVVALFDIVKSLPGQGYSEQTVKRLLDPLVTGMPRTIFDAKRNGLAVDLPLIKKLLAQLGTAPSFWLLGLPLLLLPCSAHRALWRAHNTSIFKRTSKSAQTGSGA
jgi:glycosyltransferase involved in cell wall biosynthesis